MRPMLGLWRRHTPKCPHRKKGRAHIKCKCPIWVDGELHGKRFRLSTGVRDWQRALKKVAAWESPDVPSVKLISDAVEGFLAHCRKLAPSTNRKYTNVMRQLEAFGERESISTMAELSVEALDRYRAAREIGRVTAGKELQTLRQFFSFCLGRGWVADNPAKRIKPLSKAKPVPVEPYNGSEVAAILSACDEFGRTRYERLRARAMILLLRYTGLRISDVATLERRRVRNGHVILHTQKTGGLVLLEILSNVVDGAGQAARCSISSPSLNFFPSKTWTISSEPLSLRQRTSA